MGVAADGIHTQGAKPHTGGDALPDTAAPVVLYCILAYAITWLGVSPLVASALGWYEGEVPAAWHAVGALGPVGAAYLTARIMGGRPGVRAWLGTVTRWRIPLGWWVVAAGSPLALLAIAAGAARLMTGEWGDGQALEAIASNPDWWIDMAVASVAYGLGEEPGWRGFLLPRLMRRRSALAATLLTALIWATWHTPFFMYRYDFGGPVTLIGFFIAMAAGACWLTFLYLSTGGSVPAVATWHVVWNVVNMVAAQMSDTVVGLLNGAMMALGFGVLLIFRSRLQLQSTRGDPAPGR